MSSVAVAMKSPKEDMDSSHQGLSSDIQGASVCNEEYTQVHGIPLYNTEQVQTLLKGLTIPDEMFSDSNKQHFHEKQSKPAVETRNTSEDMVFAVSDKMMCSYCSVTFSDRDEQKDHYKSDWHRFNLKLQLRGLPNITEEEFDRITGDISSLSGSDSESDASDENQHATSMEKRLLAMPHFTRHQGASDTTDSESESDHMLMMKRHLKVFMRNEDGQLLSVHRCVLAAKKEKVVSETNYIDELWRLPSRLTWAVLMAGAGHFAGAVFDKDKVVEHKTFHRYVVRAKRGTAQSSRDKQGNAPKSAGASIRRHNEAALTQEIHDLMTSWKDQLSKCDRIFMRAPSFNRTIFFSGKDAPFQKIDPRIRMIPFPTRRATFKEIKRVHLQLATIDCYGKDAQLSEHFSKSPSKSRINKEKSITSKKTNEPLEKRQDSSSSADEEGDVEISVTTETISTLDLEGFGGVNLRKPRTKKKKIKKKSSPDKSVQFVPERQAENTGRNDTEEIYIDKKTDDIWSKFRDDIYTACKVGQVENLDRLLSRPDSRAQAGSVDVSSDVTPSSIQLQELLNSSFDTQGNTLLHIASKSGHACIIPLLLDAGVNPALKNNGGILPYNICGTKACRNEFRRYMAKNPEKYDYISAQVPAPLTEEMEEERKSKEAERKKAQRKARKERLKDTKEEEKKMAAEEMEKRRFAGLSDREKRALAAERRLLQQRSPSEQPLVLSRCWQCGGDMTGKVPFEYYDYRFCSPKCLKEHKKQNVKQ